MHEFAVIRFRDSEMMQRGTDAIKRLHAEGRVKIYGTFVVAKNPSGKLSIRKVTKRGHGATAAGALIGGLVGLPLGPLAMTIGAAAVALIGHSAELLYEGNAAEFVQKTSRDLVRGGTFAVVEIAAGGLKELTAVMEGIGGTVTRN